MTETFSLEKIRNEARFYCYGAPAAINIQREKDINLQNQLNATIEKSQDLKEVLMLTLDELTLFTSNYVKNKIRATGHATTDLNNVGWEIGLICYVWSNSLPVCKGNFTGIFIATWETYFS